MKYFVQSVTAASRLCWLAAMVLLGGAVLVVTQMVFIRYVLNGSTIWQTEFVTYALISSTFLACPYALPLRGHVNVDLLGKALPGRGGWYLDVLARGLSLAFCGLLGWSSWLHFHKAWVNDWTTQSVWALPLWIPLLPMPVGIGLLGLQYIAEFFKNPALSGAELVDTTQVTA
jgi:TRAP-type C4-dicarboxylate transport system permease small subunit